MKNIRLFLCSLIFTGILFSCNDATDFVQKGEISADQTFTSVNDLSQGISRVYDLVNVENTISFTSVFTDEVGIGLSNGGQYLDDYRWILNNTSAGPTNIWTSNYALINAANRLIAGAENVVPTATELTRYNRIVSEARAIRAFAYFQLLTYFSTDLKDDNALGVILFENVPAINDPFLPRATNGEVFELITRDLAFADTNIGIPSATPYKFITKNFITALRARIALYRGKYTEALANAETLISSSGLALTAAGTGTTTGTSPYLSMFGDINGGEGIFTLDRPIGKTSVVSIFFANSARITGGVLLDVGRNLNNILASNVRDIRLSANRGSTSLVNPNYLTSGADYRASDQLIINKYPGKTGLLLLNDIKVFRLSEMYLIKAEALANAGNLNGATNSVASVIKQIRDARTITGTPASVFPLPVYANATEAWAAILLERRIELCFEGHRYIDLKRLGALANATIDRNIKDCDFNNACSLEITDYRFTLPIPLIESRVNTVIREQQNPGY